MLETLENLSDTQGRENSITNKSISREVGAAYLAALIDGEGHIHAGVEDRTKRDLGPMLRIHVQIHNTHYMLLNKAAQILLDNEIPFCWTLDYRKEYTHGCGSLHVAGKKRVRKLLELVIPHLSSKKYQGQLLLELINYRDSLVLSSKREERGELLQDSNIQRLIGMIKDEKKNYPSLLEFSRRPNNLLIPTNPSTTTRPLVASATNDIV